jgi:putative membrane protein
MTQKLVRFASVFAGAAASLAVPALAFAQQPERYEYYRDHMWSGGWGMWFLGPVMMLLFIAAAVVLVVLLVRWLGGDGSAAPSAPRGKAPLDILQERFARGEIDAKEFEARRKLLEE